MSSEYFNVQYFYISFSVIAFYAPPPPLPQRQQQFSSQIQRPSGAVVKGAGRYTKSPGFESRVRHRCQTVRPSPRQWLHLKTGRWEVPGSFLGRACRPSRSEFSVVFSETRVNTDKDLLKRHSRRALHLWT